MASRITLLTAPAALVVAFGFLEFTSLPDWVAIGAFIGIGLVFPVVYDEHWWSGRED